LFQVGNNRLDEFISAWVKLVELIAEPPQMYFDERTPSRSVLPL
jgi:hypothetical protein